MADGLEFSKALVYSDGRSLKEVNHVSLVLVTCLFDDVPGP